MQDILIKSSPNDKARPVNITAAKHGQYGYIFINDLCLVSSPDTLCAKLRVLIAILESATVAQRATQMPVEMAQPETAWPYLLDRFPWIFDGLTLSAEPYSRYLKGSASASADAEAISHLVSPSQADVAGVLFKDRTKTGGAYRRRILNALNHTTTNQDATYTPNFAEKAA